MMRYAHLVVAVLLGCMLSVSVTFNAAAEAETGLLLAQLQKQKSQPVAQPQTTQMSPAAPAASPGTDGQITNVTTTPASGLLHTGTRLDVQWQWPGYTNRPVDVTLWSGTTQVAVISSRWTGQSVGWNVPYNIAPGPYKVRVQSSNNSSNFSEAMVRLELCTLTVTSPTQANTFSAGSSTTQIAWTFTGGNPGPLKLELVPAGGGSGQLIADNIPYLSSQYSWQIPVNTNPGNYQIRITSMANSMMTAASQTFSIYKFGSVGIVVADPNNAPIDGAIVTVVVNGTGRSVTTKTNGQALFDLLPPGTYTFTATKSGYYQPGTAGTTIILASGATQSGVIKLEKFGSVTISVSDLNNAPIEGATVTVVVNGVARSATTQTNGQTIFDSLTPGAYTFTAKKDGYIPGLNQPAGTTVVLASAATQSGVIKLQRVMGSISIAVTDPTDNNRKIDGATVTVTVNGVARSATTSQEGKALFDALPPGIHVFTARKDGYIPFSNANTAVMLTGAETNSGALQLQHERGTLMVTLKDDAGNPVNNMGVTAFPVGNVFFQSIAQGKTSADGTVKFSNVLAIPFTIGLDMYVYTTSQPRPHYIFPPVHQGTDVTVKPNATTNTTIPLLRLGIGIITVTDGTMPIYNAYVRDGQVEKASYYNGRTDALGKVTLDLEPGSRTVRVSADGYKEQVISVTVSAGGTLTQTVTLTKQ